MESLKQVWNKPPRWSDLANIGSSRIAKSTVVWIFVVPFLARILYPINSIEISLGGERFSIDMKLPFYWELLFFASLFFAAGTVLHSISCPKFLALYKGYPQFLERGKCNRTILSVMSKTLLEDRHYHHICTTKDAAYRFILDYVKGGELLSKKIRESKGVRSDLEQIFFDAEIEDGREREAFNYLYNFKEDLKREHRRVIFLSYLIGFLFIGLILIQNIFT